MALMETLDIPEIYSRFDEYLAIEADDELDSVLVCNIRFCMICCKANFLQALMTSEYSLLGSIGITPFNTRLL